MVNSWPNETWPVTESASGDFIALTTPRRGLTTDCSHDIMLARYVTEVIVCLPITLLGIIGNILAFVVLSKQKPRMTTTVILRGIAIIDTLVLSSSLLLRSLRYLSLCHDWQAYMDNFTYIFRWVYPCTYSFRQLDVWLTVLLTIDLWIVICKPQHAQRLCTMPKTYMRMIVLAIAAFVITLPRYFEYHIADGRITTNSFLLRYIYTLFYRIVLFSLSMYVIPMLITIIFNAMLLKALHKSGIYRQALRESESCEEANTSLRGFRSITWIVVIIVFICVISNLLGMVTHILWSLIEMYRRDPYYSRVDTVRRHFALANNVMITINSSINVVIYFIWSKNFRASFMCTSGVE